MRFAVLALTAIGTFWLAAPARAQTYDPDYPVCMHIYGPVGYFDCRYASLAQCRPLASGLPALCIENPYFAPRKARAERRSRRPAN